MGNLHKNWTDRVEVKKKTCHCMSRAFSSNHRLKTEKQSELQRYEIIFISRYPQQ